MGEVVFGQPSWRLETPEVTAFITEQGGHLGPVTFRLDGEAIEPFSVAPWYDEEPGAGEPQIIRVLRGDFFCLPFGANWTEFQGERHELHGETANAKWKGKVAGSTLSASLKTKVRPGTVDKEISLRPGHLAVYSRHTIRDMSGPMSIGHHAMLRFRSEGLISTSPIKLGQVFPEQLEDPALGGYSSLKQGARFSRLEVVPMADGGIADLSRYPAREGFEDLVMLVNENESGLAWSAVSFPAEGYVWYCLKDAGTLASTILWHSNGGRHYSPWNGRHRRVLGIEEVTGYFHYGVAESFGPNPLQEEGVRTFVELSPARPLVVNTIMGVAPIPSGFGRVASIEPFGGGLRFESELGDVVDVAVDVDFLLGS